MDSIAVKLFHDGDVRRTRVAADAGFSTVQEAATGAYGTAGELKWKDEDDDLVSIKCDADWRECVSAANGKVVRLTFFPARPQPVTVTFSATAAATSSSSNVDANSVSAPAPAKQHRAVQIQEVDDRARTPPDQQMPEGSEHILAEIAEIAEAGAAAAADKLAASAMAASSSSSSSAAAAGFGTDSPVHRGIECDVTGENPITGTRYHLIGYNYDLNEAAFGKLPEEHRALYEVIAAPGAQPQPYSGAGGDVTAGASKAAAEEAEQRAVEAAMKRSEGLLQHPIIAAHVGMLPGGIQDMVKQVDAHIRAHALPGRRCHGRRGQCGGMRQRREEDFVAEGDVLPEAAAQRGSFGPGVAQLQHALISLDAMPASAIRWRAGFYGPNTTEAIREFRLKEGIEGPEPEAGAYTPAVREKLLAHLALLNEADAEAAKAEADDQQPAVATTTRRSVPEGSPYPIVLDEGEAIARAWYGNPRHEFDAEHGRDVTALANGPDAPSLVASNSVWGDPAVGVRKVLIVETVAAPAAEQPATATTADDASRDGKWAAELQALTDMGFLDLAENLRLLELHNGTMPLVIGGLV